MQQITVKHVPPQTSNYGFSNSVLIDTFNKVCFTSLTLLMHRLAI